MVVKSQCNPIQIQMPKLIQVSQSQRANCYEIMPKLLWPMSSDMPMRMLRECSLIVWVKLEPVIQQYLQTEFQKRNVEDFAVFREVRRVGV